MKKADDSILEDFVAKLMSETELEAPSDDFTSKVMQEVAILADKKILSYEPLISRKYWLLLAFGFILLMSYLLFGVPIEKSDWFAAIQFNRLFQMDWINSLLTIQFSASFRYGIMAVFVILLIQIPLLKYYFDKNLTYYN